MAPVPAAASPAIQYQSLLHSHPSSAPLSAANSPEKSAAVPGSPLRQSSTPRTPVTASPMKVHTSPVQRQALAAIIAVPNGSASSSASSSALAPSSMQPSIAALAAAQLAWQRQQLESTALRMAPFAQLRAAPSRTAVSKTPAPLAAPLASPSVAARPAAISMVDSIVASYGDEPTPILLVHHLPPSVSCEMLGSLFCCFGRLRVQQLYTLSTSAGGAAGLTGVLHFQSAQAALKARVSMVGRVYDLTSSRENHPHQLSPQPQRWNISEADLVFAHAPLTTRPAPSTVVKLVGYNRGPADACAADFNRHNAVAGHAQSQPMFMFA